MNWIKKYDLLMNISSFPMLSVVFNQKIKVKDGRRFYLRLNPVASLPTCE